MRYSFGILFQSLLFSVFFIQNVFAACSSPAGSAGQMGFGITGIGSYQYCNNTNWLTFDEGNEGPIIHFKFDEVSGTFANDSVSGYLLPFDNTPTWLPAGGEIGGAINFAGASFQGLGDPYFSIDPGVPMTYSFWIRPTSTSTDYAVVMINDNSNGVWFDPNSTNLIVYVSDNADLVSSSSISNGVWTHVAITDDGTTSKLYINGTEEDSFAGSVYFALRRIGVGLWGGNYAFDGRLDDLRMYNRVLSSAEITALYDKTISNYVCSAENAINYESVSKHFMVCKDGVLLFFVPGSTGAACAVAGQISYAANEYSFCNGTNNISLSSSQIVEPTANLTHKWLLDESAGTTADDAPGGSDGTLTNGGTWQITGGKISGALQFDGANDYVAIPALSLSSPYSLGFWMKRTVDPSGDYMAVLTEDDENGLWHDPNTSALTVYDTGGVTLLKGGSVPTNVWTHVVLTDDGVTSIMYINGKRVRSGTDRIGFVLNSFGNGFGGGSDINFNGLLDDVRVYSSVLTPTQVQHLYLSAP